MNFPDRKTTADHIDEILGRFHVANIHKAMTAVGWEWHRNGVRRVPTEDEIRGTARHLLEGVAGTTGDTATLCSGGLCAHRDHDILSIEFTLEAESNEDEIERERLYL